MAPAGGRWGEGSDAKHRSPFTLLGVGDSESYTPKQIQFSCLSGEHSCTAQHRVIWTNVCLTSAKECEFEHKIGACIFTLLTLPCLIHLNPNWWQQYVSFILMLITLFATNRSIEFNNTFTSKWGIDGQLRWRPKSAKWGPLVCVGGGVGGAFPWSEIQNWSFYTLRSRLYPCHFLL